MKPLDRRLLRHAAAARHLITATAATGAATAVATVAQAVLLADLISGFAIEHRTPGAMRGTLIKLVAVIAARALLSWAGEELPRRAAAGVTAQLRAALLARAVELGPRWWGVARRGELVTLATSGVDGLEAYTARYLPQLMLAALLPVFLLGWLLLTDPLSALIAALTLPLIPLFGALVGWHTQRRTRRRLAALQVLGGHILDVVTGLPTLKSFGRAARQGEAVRRTSAEYQAATMATLRVAFLSSLVLELVATLSVAVIAVSVGLRLVGGELDLRTGLAVLIVAPEVYLPLRSLGAQFHASLDGLASADRLFTLLDGEVTADEAALPAPQAPQPAQERAVTDPALVPIAVQGVSVRYAGSRPEALHGTSLTVAPGRITVVTGPSGAGKTTLLQTIAGLLDPDAGRVEVGGVPLPALDQGRWRSAVGYLPQQPRLLAGTVADAVRLGAASELSDVQVWGLLRQAGVAGEVAALPGGVHAALGDDGARLSAGQRQRIGLARVFGRDARLLVLDEPTSALDPGTEAQVLAAIAEHARGRTVVIASHRIAALDIADDVIRLVPPEAPPGSDAPLAGAPAACVRRQAAVR